MGYGNSGTWSGGGSYSSKSHESSHSWKNYLVCESCNNWSTNRAPKNGFLCRNWLGAQDTRCRSSRQCRAGSPPVGLGDASTSMPLSLRASTCSRRIRRQVETGSGALRSYVPPASGHPPPADRESFRNSTTMVDKAWQRMRNNEKKSAEMAGKGRAGP